VKHVDVVQVILGTTLLALAFGLWNAGCAHTGLPPEPGYTIVDSSQIDAAAVFAE